MLRNLILSAAGAGVVVCLVVGGLQIVTTEPLILYAELFENAGDAPAATGAEHTHEAGEATAPHEHAGAEPGHHHDAEAWQPADGLERTLYTLLADLLVGVAVSLMLLAAMVVRGQPIDAKRGLMWGAAGFVAASLLPALGLPPELPGTPAAELLGRQIWWLGTAFASAGGLALLAFGKGWMWRVAGLALLVAPHAIGAPVPPSHDAAYPAGLAGEFVVASIVVSAVLWSLSGLASGWLYARLSRSG
jgi:cobalt transporter subunit CbtA